MMSGMKEKDAKEWCDVVASLGIDILLDEGIVKPDDLDRAIAIVSEEIWTRLAMGDLPPPVDGVPQKGGPETTNT
jgi:hypothetical protein